MTDRLTIATAMMQKLISSEELAQAARVDINPIESNIIDAFAIADRMLEYDANTNNVKGIAG